MRLSDFAPRVNNVRVSGVGDTSCPTGYALYGPTNTCTQVPGYRLEKVLGDYLQAAQLGQYGSPPPSPDQMASMLMSEAANICAQSFIPCDGSEQSIVQGYIQWYTSWFQALPPVQSQPVDTSNPNALNTNAPTGSSPITQSVNVNGGQFKVGDTIRVVVTGPPNTPVSLVGSKNGASFPLTQVGATDGSGNYVYSAVLGADTVGSWVEDWYLGNAYNLGGARAGSISFAVSASALQPPVTKPPVTAGQVLNNQTQGGSQATGNGTSGSNTSQTSGGILDWLTQPISGLGDGSVPMWWFLAGGGVILLLVMKD